MIIRVFYTEISPQTESDVYDKLLQSFPSGISNKILKYSNEKERHLRIVGKALLAYALKQPEIQSGISLEQYDYSATNQPILKGSDLKFSISHSNNIVVCAITKEGTIGVDVEKTKHVKLDLMKFYFNRESWFEIINAPDVYAEFYRHWTMREAAIKASGQEIDQMELSEMFPEDHTIQVRNEIYYCRMLPVRYDYTVCLASGKEIEDVELNKLNIEDLV
jgi:4'-phosphopantetheinyl transferase